MKQFFNFTLKGEEWHKLYYAFWVPMLLLLLLSLARKPPVSNDTGALLGELALTLAFAFLQMIVQAYFQVPFLRTWLPRLSIGGKSPSFGGDTTDFLKLNVLGFLLSVVTLGIYLPWYLKNVMDYLARETTFDGSTSRFLGRGGRLLGYFAVWLVVLVAFGLGVVVLFVAAAGNLAHQDLDTTKLVVTGLTFLLVLLGCGPLLYLVYQWLFHFSWNGLLVRWKTTFWASTGFVVGQILLSTITLGIYFPVAVLQIFGYFVRRTVVERTGVPVVNFGFEGKISDGFGLLWTQGLLTVVTLGFYYPWAFAKVAGWVAKNTFSVEVPSSAG